MKKNVSKTILIIMPSWKQTSLVTKLRFPIMIGTFFVGMILFQKDFFKNYGGSIHEKSADIQPKNIASDEALAKFKKLKGE